MRCRNYGDKDTDRFCRLVQDFLHVATATFKFLNACKRCLRSGYVYLY